MPVVKQETRPRIDILGSGPMPAVAESVRTAREVPGADVVGAF